VKKALFFVVAVVLAAGVAHGQGAARVRDDLARPDVLTGARVDVRMSQSTAAAITALDRNPGRTTMTVYGVRIYSDNSQNARENAYAAQAQFAELHPDIPVVVKYQTPHFLVTAGKFVDRTDAVALSGRVLAQFPKAMVVPQEVSLAEVIVALRTEPEPEPGPEDEIATDGTASDETVE
jgi:hypothetical protein